MEENKTTMTPESEGFAELEDIVEKRAMPKAILNRLAALMSVKSIVTLVLTGVFAFMACTNQISQDFMTIYAVIIAFYFGTQSQKVQEILTDNEGQ